MGGLNLITLGAQTAYIVTKTFWLHFTNKKSIIEESEARKDITFDQAFNIVRNFLKKSSEGTVEDLQRFCGHFVPSPAWVTVITVRIPAEWATKSAKILIEHVGEKTMNDLIGGKTWWQHRATADGCIEAEWIAMKRDWDGKDLKQKTKEQSKRKLGSDSDIHEAAEKHGKDQYEKEMDEQRCLFYVHGGGYYFGSLNTHRYSIWRMARKMGGRAFAVRYRLSPQFPFPCALQDALAAYLYLIDPPSDSPHQPVAPSKMVFAGDSAGGGMILSLLCLLRDMELPMPAGAVLISPWCDLTESFPSILTNVDTDVIPPYGFIHRPSTLWPPLPAADRALVDTFFKQSLKDKASDAVHHRATEAAKEAAKERREEARSGTMATKLPDSAKFEEVPEGEESGSANFGDKADPDASVWLEIDGEQVEFKDQLHLYATNVQLSHPLVSPALQPSLGGLPPLHIICGDNEILRDEIVYTAHRAASPDQYPLRKALWETHGNERRAEAAKHYKPTDVHLQIYDGMCHDLPLFSFIPPARYCYRAMASFCVAVTSPEIDVLSPSGSSREHSAPEFTRKDSHATSTPNNSRRQSTLLPDTTTLVEEPNTLHPKYSVSSLRPARAKPSLAVHIPQTTPLPADNKHHDAARSPPVMTPLSATSPYPGAKKKWSKKKLEELKETLYTESQPYNRPDFENHMIRERISARGIRRDLEPASEIKGLQLDPENIGLLHAGPVKRYLQGRKKWDEKFTHTTKSVRKQRRKQIEAAAHAERSRLQRTKDKLKGDESDDPSAKPFSIWSMPGENPPPSSIAARKDTKEALKLADVVTKQYSSSKHPLTLWTEIQNMSLLQRASAHQAGDAHSDTESIDLDH